MRTKDVLYRAVGAKVSGQSVYSLYGPETFKTTPRRRTMQSALNCTGGIICLCNKDGRVRDVIWPDELGGEG